MHDLIRVTKKTNYRFKAMFFSDFSAMTKTLTALVNRKPLFTITALDMGMQNRIPNSLPQAIM